MALDSLQARVIATELQGLIKVPFRDRTWLGPGHSEPFRKTFGFEAFALATPSFVGMLHQNR